MLFIMRAIKQSDLIVFRLKPIQLRQRIILGLQLRPVP
jgi:hypothetical protein